MNGSRNRGRTASGYVRLSVLFSLAIGSLLGPFAPARAQDNGQNDANNPLTPKITVNLQDYYIPSMFSTPNRAANQFLLRGLLPHDLFGAPQLFRVTVPLVTAPTFPTGSDTGLGDVALMNLFMFPGKEISFGVGPMLIAPTATSDALGAGKWQAGVAAVAVAPQHWGLIGGLATFQHSFAGDGARPDVSLLTAQPILFYNLPDGFYLRSSGTWNFDLKNSTYYIPVGFGVGKVFSLGKGATMNAFIEPQYTAIHKGLGAPKWQIFAGLNFQFSIGR